MNIRFGLEGFNECRMLMSRCFDFRVMGFAFVMKPFIIPEAAARILIVLGHIILGRTLLMAVET